MASESFQPIDSISQQDDFLEVFPLSPEDLTGETFEYKRTAILQIDDIDHEQVKEDLGPLFDGCATLAQDEHVLGIGLSESEGTPIVRYIATGLKDKEVRKKTANVLINAHKKIDRGIRRETPHKLSFVFLLVPTDKSFDETAEQLRSSRTDKEAFWGFIKFT